MMENEDTKEAIDNFITIQDLYDIANNSAVKGVTNITFPIIGSIINDTVKSALNSLVEEKQNLLIESIMNDNEITIDSIPDRIAFIHDFIRILECVKKLKRNEKIIYFANILKSEYKKDNLINRAEDFTILLDGISYETLIVLAKLYLYEKENNIKFNSELSEVCTYWGSFIESCISKNKSFTHNIINSHLSILHSKGICKEFTGAYLDYKGEVYKITEYGYLFIKSINNCQFEKEFIDPKDEIYDILKLRKKPDIEKYGIVKYYNYLKILEKEGKLKLSKPINVLNAPCSQYKVLDVY